MATAWGSPTFGVTTKTIPEGDNAPMVPGRVYRMTGEVTGIRTLVPGWEDEAVAHTYSEIVANGATPTYIQIDTTQYGALDVRGQVTIEFTYTPTSPTAAVAPIVWAVVIGVIMVLAIWLILTVQGAVTEVAPLVPGGESGMILIGAALLIGIVLLQRSQAGSAPPQIIMID